LAAQSLPNWIEEMPVDTAYYYARENVSSRGLSEEEYQLKANVKALFTISMQMKSSLSGSASLSFIELMTEKDDSYSDKFEQTISVSTISDIIGAEKVDDYMGLGEVMYWTLWRLSKEKYRETRRKSIQQINDYYDYYLSLVKTDYNHPGRLLEVLIPAYAKLLKMSKVFNISDDELIRINDKGKKIILRADITTQIKSIVSNLQLGDKQTISGNYYTGVADPLKLKIQYEFDSPITSRKETIPARGIPIKFVAVEGDIEITRNNIQYTNDRGEADLSIVRFNSDIPRQTVKAIVDLIHFVEDETEMKFIEKYLTQLTSSMATSFTINVSLVLVEMFAVITVSNDLEIDELKSLSRHFSSKFGDLTEIKLKDELHVDSILEEYKRRNDICSDTECQIEIGKELGVDKLLFIDISEQLNVFECWVFLRDIQSKELIKSQSYRIQKNQENDPIYLISENASEIVIDFWRRLNPSKLTILSDIKYVTAEIKPINSYKWDSPEKREYEKLILPIYSKEFLANSYLIHFSKSGYDSITTDIIDLTMGKHMEIEIDLSKKTPWKAFRKSLLFPGRGQRYSYDESRKDRLTSSRFYYRGTLIGLSASLLSWGAFEKTRRDYNDAYSIYLKQKSLEDVNHHRQVTEEKNNLMKNMEIAAWSLSGFTAGFWLWNAFEAYVKFPDFGIDVSGTYNPGTKSPSLAVGITW